MRIVLLILLLATAAAAGWFARGLMFESIPPPPAATPAAIHAAPEHRTVAHTPVTPPPTTQAGIAAPLPTPPHSEIGARLRAARLLKASGLPLGRAAYYSTSVPPELVAILDLSVDEVDSLNAIHTTVQQSIEAARTRLAEARFEDDGRKIIVEAPALDAQQSALLFEQTLSAVRGLLGPERFALFNELWGEGFEAAYGHFGLSESVRYEMSLLPAPERGDGSTVYKFRRHTANPTTGTTGWGDSLQTTSSIRRDHPMLARFLPPDL